MVAAAVAEVGPLALVAAAAVASLAISAPIPNQVTVGQVQAEPCLSSPT